MKQNFNLGFILSSFLVTIIVLSSCENDDGFYVTDKYYDYHGVYGHIKLMLHKSNVKNEPDFMELEFLEDTILPDSVEIIKKQTGCIIEKDTVLWSQGYYYLVDDINKLFDKNSSIYVRFYLNGKSSKVLLRRKSTNRKKAFIAH